MTDKQLDVRIDQVLYSCIAIFGFTSAYFSTDEAYKYVTPYMLFWIKYASGVGGATAGALKMYRSTGFAEHKEEKRKTGETEFFAKQKENQ